MDTLALVAHPMRRRILRLVWEHERSAGEIASALPITFGGVSQHLAALRAAGVVTVRPEGRHRYYRADRDRLGPLAAALEASWNESLDRLERALREDAAGEAGGT